MYNPTREWNPLATAITLPNDNVHFLYCAVPTPEDTTENPVVFASESHLEPKETDGWITYKLGTIQAPVDGKREAVMLWGNTRGSSTPQLQADWNQATATAKDFIKNKPSIPASQVNADWNAVSGVAQILNKPTIPNANDVISGDGMDFVTNDPVTLGLPSEVNSISVNEVTANSHTHKLGNVTPVNVLSETRITNGAMYNWYVGVDGRKISSSDDWEVLDYIKAQELYYSYLGGGDTAGGKLKESGYTHWLTPNLGAVNSVKFNMIGNGLRSYSFGNLKEIGLLWITDDATVLGGTSAEGVALRAEYNNVVGSTFIYSKYYGAGIRLCKPTTSLTHGQTGTYTGNDGKVYPTICIGDTTPIEYLACNLNETEWHDHTFIEGFNGGVYTPITNVNWVAKTTSAMCYFNDDETIAEEQTPIETTLIDIQNQINLIHNPVTIATASAALASVDENQVLTLPLGTIALKDFWTGTATAYTALGTYDANTIYHIEE